MATTSTDLDIIEHVADMLGYKYGVSPPRRENWSAEYRVMSTGKRAIETMCKLYPHMGQRRQSQIENAIGFVPEIRDSELKRFEWLVGLLEGEGSFLSGPPSEPNKPRIQVFMTDQDTIEKVANEFRTKPKGPYERNNPRAKLQYVAVLRGKRAVDLMRKMRPHMGERRQAQIDSALAGYVYNEQKGQTHSQAKLTDENVRYIKRELAKNVYGTGSRLAKEFGVDPKVITCIKQGKTWSHVTLED